MLTTGDVALRVRVMPDLLAEALEAAIVFGELDPGSRVIEEEIASRYGVSRSPVRDALCKLEADGLVVREEHKGVRVTPVSRRDPYEVYRCRIELEGIAAKDAARNWVEPMDQILRSGLGSVRKAYASRDVKEYFLANVAFTDAVHQASGNVTLIRLMKSIGKQALRYRYLAYRSAPRLMGVSVQGTDEIVELILFRQGRKARRATAKLIEGSWQTIRVFVPEA